MCLGPQGVNMNEVMVPQQVRRTGIRKGLLEDLALKVLYIHGEMSLVELSEHTCLGLGVIEEIFQFFRKEQLCAETIEGGAASESSILVSAVLVPAQPSQRLVVAFGDSVTDGDRSTMDADAHGVKLIGATISPFEDADFPGYYSGSKEAARQAVNKWIRTSDSFDGVIDFDAVLRDPDHPSRLLPRFASKDRLHPNDAGYQAMANSTNSSMFQ